MKIILVFILIYKTKNYKNKKLHNSWNIEIDVPIRFFLKFDIFFILEINDHPSY